MRHLRTALALTAATLFSLTGTAIATDASAAGQRPAAQPGGVVGPADESADASAQLPLADPTPAAKKLFTIRDERVDESSGLAKSQKYEGIYWTVNDSGDTARVFGIDTTGRVKAVLRFKAQVRDVEAIAVDRDGTIYVADIGDNKSTRDRIEIYTLPEPDELTDAENVRYHRYDFEYPDGAHDAETLLVKPGSNQLYIVTKVSEGKGAIYAAPPNPSRQGTNKLTKLAAAPSGVFTDGTFLPDGKRVVLRTYVDVATVAWGTKPTLVARGAVPLAQGESVAVGQASNTVLVGSEGKNSAVYQVQVPAKKAAATPTPTATPPAAAGSESTSDSGKSGNLRWILIGAAFFALIITVLTFPLGRRERRDRMAENARLTGQAPPTPHRRHHA